MSIKIDDLAKTILKELQDYKQEVDEVLDEKAIEVADKAVKTLKETSPVLTGDYKKSWSKKKEKSKVIVHNPKEYRLTHLLERGHATINGGRTKAQPHIAPVEQQVIEDYTREVEERLG